MVKIIAEAGVNHNGNFDYAMKLIEVAADAKANFIKFQTFSAENLVSKSAKKAFYQTKNLKNSDSDFQYEMLKKLEMPYDWYPKLIDYCKKFKIGFLSTPFDCEGVDFLDSLEIPLFKVSSGDLTNKMLLKHLKTKNKPIILSTGMSYLEEIKSSVDIILNDGYKKTNLTILHCNTEYPTPYEDVNLNAMLDIRDKLDIDVGYSDHTLGIEVPIAAVALGAKVIEKHITIDKTLNGPDHSASIEPYELKAMVKSIRNIEKSISGDGHKKPSKSEIKNLNIARKSIHINKHLKKDHKISVNDIIMKRPGDGISPMDYEMVIGKKTNRYLEKDSKLKWDFLKK